MTFNTLMKALTNDSEITKQILGNYKGTWTLGIRLDPDDKDKYALALHVGIDKLDSFAREIMIEGEKIKVVVEHGFKIRPLRGE